MPDRPTCQDCRFWETGGPPSPEMGGPASGLCRRYPPLSEESTTWPESYATDWCGEHESYGVNVTIPQGVKDAHKAMYDSLVEHMTLATKGKVS